MKKLTLITGALSLLVASSAMGGGVNFAWNDCVGGGGVADRTVACTNSGSGFAYASLNPSQSYPNVGATDVYIDVAPAVPIGPWWNPTPTTTRWGSGDTEPASGACTAWWAAASNRITFQPPQAFLVNPSRMRLRITSVVGQGEEQPMEPGTEYFVGSLELKFNAGTADNPECSAGGLIGIAVFPPSGMVDIRGIVILQPGQPDNIETAVDVANCVTFQNPPTRQCPGATPTQKSTWGSIKALYR
jgi:hypothetical protein